MGTKSAHLSGSASSGKIASTGHSGSHAPQSMHSSGSMIRIRSNSWMQSTGQTSTQERSLMSMQGSAMMYVTGAQSTEGCGSGREVLDEVFRALVEGGFGYDLVEPRLVCTAQALGVGVVREAEQRHVRVGVRDLVRVDPRHVRDHAVGRVDAVGGRQVMSREKAFQLSPEEEVDPYQQDRRHRGKRTTVSPPLQRARI